MNGISKNSNEKESSKKLKKKNYTSYSTLSEVKLITIGLASPENIKQWSEKTLPNGKILGEVMNANTLHHKTFKPQKGGLFCERIFGPLKDFECACGKSLKLKKEDKLNKKHLSIKNISDGIEQKNVINLNKSILGGVETKTKNFCSICEVEYTWSVMRRYQLGYINLISPVTHVWYLKGNPSYLSILLDIKKRHLESIVYCSETLTLENSLKGGITSSKSSDIVASWKKLKRKIKAQRENQSFGSLGVIEDSGILNSSGSTVSDQSFKRNDSPEINKNSLIDYKKQFQDKLSIFRPVTNSVFPSYKDKIDNKFECNALGYTLPILKKIEKRENLKLKKYGFWKELYNIDNKEIFKTKINLDRKILDKYIQIIDNVPPLTFGLRTRPIQNTSKVHNRKKNLSWYTFLSNSLMQLKFKYNSDVKAIGSDNKKTFHFKSPPPPFGRGRVKKLKNINDFYISYIKNHKSLKGLKFLRFTQKPLAKLSKYTRVGMIGTKHSDIAASNYTLDINNVDTAVFKSKLNTYLKKYSQKIDLKSLKLLSYLILQERSTVSTRWIRQHDAQNFWDNSKSRVASQIKNNALYPSGWESDNAPTTAKSLQVKLLRKLPIKQIIKKVSISSYILLHLNIFSQKSIYKNFIDSAWEKLSQEAYKKALIRANKILNKVDSIEYDKLLNLEPSMIGNEISPHAGSSSPLEKKLENKNLNSYSDSRQSLNNIYNRNRVDNFELKLKNLTKKIKNNFYNILNSSVSAPYPSDCKSEGAVPLPFGLQVPASFTRNAKTSKKIYVNKHSDAAPLQKSKQLNNEFVNLFSLKEKMLFNSSTLELYTLLQFPYSVSNFLISNFLLNRIFSFSTQSVKPQIPASSISTMQESLIQVQKLLNNLTLIFLKTLLKTKTFKSSFWLRAVKLKRKVKAKKSKKIFPSPTGGGNISTKSQEYAINIAAPVIGKKRFQKIKNSLINFYLIGNLNNLNQKQIYSSNKKENNEERLNQDNVNKVYHIPKGKLNLFSNKIKIKIKIKSLTGNSSTDYSGTCMGELCWLKSLKRKIKDNFLIKNKIDLREDFREKITPEILNDWDPGSKTLSFDHKQKRSSIKNFSDVINNSIVEGTASNSKSSSSFNPEGKRLQTRFQKLNEVKNKMTTAKKLYNNIYCLSHRERWEADNDWNFLYYYVTVQNFDIENNKNMNEAFMNVLEDKIIPNYKKRFENVYKTNFFNSKSNNYNAGVASSTYMLGGENVSPNKISINLNKSTLFSGPGLVQLLLSEFNFFEIKKIDKQNRILLYQLNKQILKLKKKMFNRKAKKELKEAYKKRDLLVRRTKLVRKLFIKESPPQATVLTVLPVLPPDLRPIVKMGSQIAASDLNRLYQRVIYRNDRLKKFLKDPATSNSYEMKYAQRLLQEAVDNLIQNGKSGVQTEKDSRGRALKSLSDILKGKQGRFRQYLLGKRVDYSGRSVIVVGPKLKLHECGIPKEMALELYLPFLLKRILNDNLARTVVGAKTLIKSNPSLVWELLREIMQTCPVLLNRAPTLHRLGIQAFQPKLIDGRAILLHPLVCSAFNADFDGDQMAVHVPITVEARAEAWKLMLSRNSILAPATGEPLAIPSQDMVLGCYYLTTRLNNNKGGTDSGSSLKNKTNDKFDASNIIITRPEKNLGCGFYFSKIEDALKAYELKKINLHANIWLKWTIKGSIDNGSDQEEPIEIRLDTFGGWKEIYSKSQKSYNIKNNCLVNYILTTPGKIIFNLAIQKALK